MHGQAAEGSAPTTRTVAAVLLAEEDPRRASNDHPAFALVGARTLLEVGAETLEQCPEIECFVVVVAPGLEDRVAGSLRESPKFLAAVAGGPTRKEALTAGMAALPPRFGVVVWHDLARPLASPQLFAVVLRALEQADAVVPGVPVAETVKRVEAGVVRATIPRAGLWTLQTPQGFRREALMAATRTGAGAADRAAHDVWSVHRAGLRVLTVAGEPTNIRISSPGDVRLAEALLERRAKEDGR